MSVNISVITINYNNESGLLETLNSISGQDRSVFEYIVIDGGSTDGSAAIIKENALLIDQWISETDLGIYDAMNKGILKSSGKYLMFLNSGDCLETKDVLRKLSDAIENWPGMDVFYGNFSFYNRKNRLLKEIWKHPDNLSLSFLKNTTINHQASLIKSSLFTEFGLFPLAYKLAADYWLFLISYINSKKFKYLDWTMVEYDTNGVSATDNFSEYKVEQGLLWKILVPAYVQDLVEENEYLKKLLEHKIVKATVKLNKIYSLFKGK